MKRPPQEFDKARWEKFGEWLTQQRKKCNLRQEDLAEKTGLSRQQVYRIENGRSPTKKHTALLLGRAVGVKDLTTLIQAGYDGDVMRTMPKMIIETIRTNGGLLTDEDIVLITSFINDVIEKNRQIEKNEHFQAISGS